MNHDRIHAQPPSHHTEAWSVGTVVETAERDGHWVVTVCTDDDERVQLTVTVAIRDLVCRRIDAPSVIGEQVWYRVRGG